MSECPICFENDPDTTTDCCKQRIHKLCLEQCKKSCPFCRVVTIVIIEEEVPVSHAERYFNYERVCVMICFVFCFIFIIGITIGMTFAIIENKRMLLYARNATTTG
jgi:hypothetical protein